MNWPLILGILLTILPLFSTIFPFDKEKIIKDQQKKWYKGKYDLKVVFGVFILFAISFIGGINTYNAWNDSQESSAQIGSIATRLEDTYCDLNTTLETTLGITKSLQTLNKNSQEIIERNRNSVATIDSLNTMLEALNASAKQNLLTSKAALSILGETKWKKNIDSTYLLNLVIENAGGRGIVDMKCRFELFQTDQNDKQIGKCFITNFSDIPYLAAHSSYELGNYRFAKKEIEESRFYLWLYCNGKDLLTGEKVELIGNLMFDGKTHPNFVFAANKLAEVNLKYLRKYGRY